MNVKQIQSNNADEMKFTSGFNRAPELGERFTSGFNRAPELEEQFTSGFNRAPELA